MVWIKFQRQTDGLVVMEVLLGMAELCQRLTVTLACAPDWLTDRL